ncbi:MAG TPA: YciI family protein [Chloroflexota bacterium]|nr:YciI family protein [Chloroflexota bacterium]
MKYMLMFCHEPDAGPRFEDLPADEQRRMLQAILNWRNEFKSKFVDPGMRLGESSTATTVRRRGDQYLVTDGPFVEGAEVVGGYSIVEVADLDEAIRIAKAFPGCPTTEIRPILESEQPEAFSATGILSETR